MHSAASTFHFHKLHVSPEVEAHFLSLPRLAVCAVVGLVLGFAAAVALRAVFLTLPVVIGEGVVAPGLALGVPVGAMWEGRCS